MNIAILFLICACMPQQVNNYPDRPNISGWTVVPSLVNLELKVDDYNTSSLGLETVYQNPQAPNEFVKVISRQIVLISERPKEGRSGSTQDVSTLTNNTDNDRHAKKEADTLSRIHKSADLIVFIKWRTKIDGRRGQEIQDGLMEFWLLDQSGVWEYLIQAEPDAIDHVTVTEPSPNKGRSLIVGLKLSLGNASQVLRLDPDDLKDKESEHVK